MAQKRTFRDTMVYTFLLGIVAHGYRFFNMFFSHDSMMVNQEDFAEMVSVGRFLTPVYLTIRGTYFPPALVGFLGLAYLGVSIYLVIRLLDIKDPLFVFLTCGILVTSGTVTVINATYLHDFDKYMLALLLATASVVLCRRYRYGLFTGGAALLASLGIYQSFFQAAVFLHMILAVKDLFDGRPVREVLRRGLKAIGSLLLGLALYAVTVRLAVSFFGVELSSEYNSVQRAGEFVGVRDTLLMFLEAYIYVLQYFCRPAAFYPLLMGALTLLLAAGTLLMVWRMAAAKKWEKGAKPLLFTLIALMPLGMNIVYVISKRMEHDLMVFSFYLAYVFAIYLLQTYLEGEGASRKRREWVKRGVCAALSVLVFYGVVFSNQSYLQKHLEYQNTMFTMVRVVDRIEETEGYVPGETPVVIASVRHHPYLAPAREDVSYNFAGMYDSFSLTYDTTYKWFFDDLLTYPINLVVGDERIPVVNSPEVQAMPAFPAEDSCKMVDGVLVVKLG